MEKERAATKKEKKMPNICYAVTLVLGFLVRMEPWTQPHEIFMKAVISNT